MDKEKALENVYQSLLGANSLLVKMRRGDGLDDLQWKNFREAINFLTEFYKDKESVPKKLALAFVDVSNYFYFHEGKYTDEEENKLEDAAQEIVQMADKLFS